MKPRRLALQSSIALAVLAGGQTVVFGQTVVQPRDKLNSRAIDRGRRHAPKATKLPQGVIWLCSGRCAPIR